jgi:phosphoserine phosphatase
MPRSIKLAFFNVIGTLHPLFNPYDYLHRRLDLMEESLEYTFKYQRRPQDVDRWHEAEAELWEGQDAERVQFLLSDLAWLPGATEIAGLLRGAGVELALISSGFDLQLQPEAAQLGARYWFANTLCVEDDRLTGEIEIRYRESDRGALVEQIKDEAGASADECIAFGASLFDVPMFEQVGWSAAVMPYDARVREAATVTLDDPDLTPLLPVLRSML